MENTTENKCKEAITAVLLTANKYSLGMITDADTKEYIQTRHKFIANAFPIQQISVSNVKMDDRPDTSRINEAIVDKRVGLFKENLQDFVRNADDWTFNSFFTDFELIGKAFEEEPTMIAKLWRGDISDDSAKKIVLRLTSRDYRESDDPIVRKAVRKLLTKFNKIADDNEVEEHIGEALEQSFAINVEQRQRILGTYNEKTSIDQIGGDLNRRISQKSLNDLNDIFKTKEIDNLPGVGQALYKWMDQLGLLKKSEEVDDMARERPKAHESAVLGPSADPRSRKRGRSSTSPVASTSNADAAKILEESASKRQRLAPESKSRNRS